MLSLHQVVDSLYAQARPVLTWYSSDRVELGGPVLARWFAKTANLLTNEYSDLFSPAPGVSQHIVVDLPSCWQKIVWVSAATLCGWTVTIPARQEAFAGTVQPASSLVDAAPATIYVTDHLSPAAERAQSQGADLMLHNLSLLALQWDAELPSGAIDALEALMSHNDVLENDHEGVDWPVQASSNLLQQHRLVLHQADARAIYMPLTELWGGGGSALVIDPAFHDREKFAAIMCAELPHRDSAETDSTAERRTSIGKLTRPTGPRANSH